MAAGSAPGERRGGRAKGIKNKRTRELIEILDAAGYCPVAELIEVGAIARQEYERAGEIYDAIQEKRDGAGLNAPLTDTAPTYLKLMQDSAKDVMPYLYPKRKSVELSGKDGQDLFTSFNDLVRRAVGDKPE